MIFFRCICLAALTLASLAAQTAAVRVWQDDAVLPTKRELPTDELPPFDQLAIKGSGHYSFYPYAARDNLRERFVAQWRMLNLENEYLHCRVMPDLGGHLYTCRDKRSGAEMFYANTAIRKFETAPRGSWAAVGIENSFPIAHSRLAVSPVLFSTSTGPDGSASVAVGATDRVSGMRWTVVYTLRRGAAALEQKVMLYNPGHVRQPYQWWTNAALRLPENNLLELVYPMAVTAPHGSGGLDTWPIDHNGVDLSKTNTHKDAIGIFAYGSREPFFGAYNPATKTGVVHWADPAEVPGKKAWIWGSGPGSYNYQNQLSEDHSGYVEIQAGLLPTQDMLEFMQPHESRVFTEIWIPTRDTGGITRATPDAVLFLKREPQPDGAVRLSIDLNPVRAFAGATLTVWNGAAPVFRETAALTPANRFHTQTPPLPSGPKYRFELKDSSGRVLLAHIEDTYDTVKPSEVKLGAPMPKPPVGPGPDAKALAEAENYELLRFNESAAKLYQAASAAANTPEVRKASARLSIALGRFAAAAAGLSPESDDPEVQFYLGVAKSRLGDDNAARPFWAAAEKNPRFGPAARFELACAAARAGDRAAALELLRPLAGAVPGAAALQVVLLRRLGKKDEALRVVEAQLALDPLNSLLRHERTLLGREDPGLWALLAADPEWVLDIADRYFEAGIFDDAAALLSRSYPPVPELQTEPGAVSPQDYPLVAYYRGYARMKAGEPPDEDFRRASSMSTRYVFPSRTSSFAVLRSAVERNPEDATAHYLLGCLLFHSRMTDEALAEWELAKPAAAKIPAYYQTVALVLRKVKNNQFAAEKTVREGIVAVPTDTLLPKMLEGNRPDSVVTPAAPAVVPKTVVSFDSPEHAAREALELAAGGHSAAAMAIFNAKNFPGDKQPPGVRQAYIEVQLRQMIDAVIAHKCDEARRIFSGFGGEQAGLPFTFSSFSAFTKSLRVQFYLGIVQGACGDRNAAVKAWTRIAKAGAAPDSPDFPFPVVAASTLDPASAGRQIETSLEKIRMAGGSLDPGLLLYSEGMLLRAAGREKDANERFAKGFETASGLLRFLHGAALNDAPLLRR